MSKRFCKQPLQKTIILMSAIVHTSTGVSSHQIRKLRGVSSSPIGHRSPQLFQSYPDRFSTLSFRTSQLFPPCTTSRRKPSSVKVAARHCKRPPLRRPARTLARTRSPQRPFPLRWRAQLYQAPPCNQMQRISSISISMELLPHQCRTHPEWAHLALKVWRARRSVSRARFQRRQRAALPILWDLAMNPQQAV